MNWISTIKTHAYSRKKQQQFLWLIFSLFVLVVGWDYYQNQTVNYYLVGTALICISLSFTVPFLVSPLLFVWLIFGKVMGEITSTVVLFVIYYLVFTPITLLLRINRKEFNKATWKKREQSKVNYKKMY